MVSSLPIPGLENLTPELNTGELVMNILCSWLPNIPRYRVMAALHILHIPANPISLVTQ
jgi:hypothetical protein